MEIYDLPTIAWERYRRCSGNRSAGQKKLSFRSVPAASLLVIGASVAAAATVRLFVPITIDDIVGVPSSVVVRQGERRVARSRHTANNAERHDRTESAEWRARVHERVRIVVARLHTPLHPSDQRNPKKGTASLPPPESFQNLTIGFITPYRLPVGAGVRLTAVCYPAHGNPRTLTGLKTDAAGCIRLTGLGPLPCCVDLTVTSSQGRSSALLPYALSMHPATEPGLEWRFANAQAASVLIESGKGSLTPSSATGAANHISYDWRQPEPVVLARQVTDVTIDAPAGSCVTSPALPGEELHIPQEGSLRVRLPLSALSEGPVPLRVTQSISGGEAEAIVQDYPVNPYASEPPRVRAMPRLVRLRDVSVADNIGVLTQVPGKRPKKRLSDGAWWFTDAAAPGVRIKARDSVLGTVVERFRITGLQGGSLGSVSVGTAAEDALTAFGPPDERQTVASPPGDVGDARTGDEIISYLNGGMRLCLREGRVAWLEAARPTPLLLAGTTAFAQRTPAAVYVAGFTGDARTGLPDRAALCRYLQQIPSIRLVARADQADLILTARVAEFREERDSFLLKNLPFKYACHIRLAYSISPANADIGTPPEELTASAGAGADYTGEVLGGTALVGILAGQRSTAARLAAVALGAVGIQELQRTIARAVNRCPALATRGAFAQLARDLSRAADVAVRVTHVDYATGLITIAAGSDQGIITSTDKPGEFEILIGDQALPGTETGLTADYDTAVVVEAHPDYSICQLRHIRRRANQGRERTDIHPDAAMAQRILDPASAVVAARLIASFPPLPIAPETPDSPEPGAQSEGQAQENRNDSPLAKALGTLIDHSRKKSR